MHIPFHIPYQTGKESAYLETLLQSNALAAPSEWHRKCEALIREIQGAQQVLLTTSCTHALEMAAMLIDLKQGDEVILPSFGFSSMANAVILRGATPVFVDIDPATMNIAPHALEQAITVRTKAVIIMHYGGVACAMTDIVRIVRSRGLYLIEDAAHCIGAGSGGRGLGTIGDLGVLSFHATKNIHCSEGGALLINNERFIRDAQLIAEKGTNKVDLLTGKTSSYHWERVGSSYVLGALNAAFLLAQLEELDEVNTARLARCRRYEQVLLELDLSDRIAWRRMSRYEESNGHIYFIKTRDADERTRLIRHLAGRGIGAYFHYLPLHRAPAGKRYGRISGTCAHAERESGRLLRLPVYPQLSMEAVDQICEYINAFYR